MAIPSRPTEGSIFSEVSEDSVLNSCMPPMRRNGKITMLMPMMPMPPSHCSSERHSSRPGGAVSSPVITVEPVVVRPEIVSNRASARSIR